MARKLYLRRTVQSKISIPTWQKLVRAAEADDVTVSTMVRRLIEQHVGAAERKVAA